MEFLLLGPLVVRDGDGRELRLPRRRQRALLSALLLAADTAVSRERLLEAVWGERTPATAVSALQGHVSALRKILGPERLLTEANGYRLRADGAEIDLCRFEALLAEARRSPDASVRAERLRTALALWRGEPLAELAAGELARAERERLLELRLAALEERLDADLGSGLAGELVPELTSLVAAHPYRERLRGQLMLALYRCGRQAEALEVYREGRRGLVEELGIEPGRELGQLQEAILRHDPALDNPPSVLAPLPVPSPPPALLAPPSPPLAREQRKVVTVLFCDVSDSTALGERLDPEVLRALLARYFERMRAIIERHGGTVEKFVGDAVMAVFGVPLLHEDDALRACRAALEMRQALPDLGIAARIGVNSGEVVTGTEERLATGDAVNVAARLEQAAAPGEVLIGEPTLVLVGEAVEVEPVEPLTLKGKAEPVRAFRLVSQRAARARAHCSRFVGRVSELGLIQQAWRRARSAQRCELVTIIGEAGVGKSRLVAEALTSIEAQTVHGRCLPYGDGITYWPIVEVLKQLDALPAQPAAAAAIRSLLGETEQGTSTEEIAWAFRKLLAEQAPLLVLFDDVHWGEQTFLDLVEGVSLLAADAPIMLVCLARPELLDRRPDWPVALRLEPLPADAVNELLGDQLRPDLRGRVARAAGGNPLFLTEMLAIAAESDEIEVPATLRALLAARLDQLDDQERQVLECGAVEGEIFHRGAVQALAPDEEQLTPRLTALVRRELIRPEQAQLAGEEGFRFRHLLIRDAAYEALPKSVRADLHERFADWLEQHGSELVELDELLGYHLEQAAHYRGELGTADTEAALRAGQRLAAAGRRASWRGDWHAAASLLDRALSLTRPIKPDVALELDLAVTLRPADPRRALAIAQAAAQAAETAGDQVGALAARLAAGTVELMSTGASADQLAALAGEALPLFEQAGDHGALVHAWWALALAANYRGRQEDHAHAVEQVLRHARLAGQRISHLYGLPIALAVGPRPADEALRTLAELSPDGRYPVTLLARAWLTAMLGRFDEAWQLAEEAADGYRDVLADDLEAWPLAEIATLAGDQERAATLLRELNRRLEERGEISYLSTYAPLLGRTLCALGRHDEAEPLAARGREFGTEQDVMTQALWRQVQALIHASRGQHTDAEALAREAVAITQQTDNLNLQGDALCDLAEVLTAAGRDDEAATALTAALDRYQRKRNQPAARRVHERLAALQPGANSATLAPNEQTSRS